MVSRRSTGLDREISRRRRGEPPCLGAVARRQEVGPETLDRSLRESRTIWSQLGPSTGQNGGVRGGAMSTDTLIVEVETAEIEEGEELLVEEVSIDGLCGVY